MDRILDKMLPFFYIFCLLILIGGGYYFYKDNLKNKNMLLTIEEKLDIETVGDNIQLELKNHEEVEYIVENEAVVKINSDGKLEAIGEGSSEVIVINKDNNKKQTITVNVGKTAIENYKKKEESSSNNKPNNNTTNNNKPNNNVTNNNPNNNKPNNNETNDDKKEENNKDSGNKNDSTPNENTASTNKPSNPSNPAQKQYNQSARLKINAGKIKNGNGEKVVLKGVVLPNVDTVQFNSAINKTTLKALKNDLGVNMIRFTLSPTSTMDYGTAFYRIKNAIDNASDLGMYVIINWGVMNATVGDPRLTLAKNNFNGVTTADNFFNKIAQYSNVNPYVMFEICNEPYVKEGASQFANTNTWTAVKEYADTIIPIIRKYSENIVIVAGKSGVVLTELTNDPITKYSNIAYTFHLYPYNYAFDTYSQQLSAAIEKKLVIIATETSIMDASLSQSNKTVYDTNKMDQYLEFFKHNNYDLHFAYFKFDFPFESSEYNEWSILKPIHKNYYDTRCTWNANKNLDICLQTNSYVRHMSNLNLNNKLSLEYFCSSNANKCSKEKGKGVYSISGLYFVKNFMNKNF